MANKTFEEIAVGVGQFILDTSDEMKLLIKDWINEKYTKDIVQRINWSALINFNYSFPTVAGTNKYDHPVDFASEVYVANITDGVPLTRSTEGLWWSERSKAFSGGVVQGGDPTTYIILEAEDKILLDPTPISVKTIAFPYKKIVTALSATTDTAVITDIDHILKYGAIAEALAYKKQYQKSDYYLAKYETALNARIASELAPQNMSYQRVPAARMGMTTRFSGANSYDTI